MLADSPLHYWRVAEAGGSLAHDIGSSTWHLASGTSQVAFVGYSGIAADGGSAYVDGGGGLYFAELSQRLPVPGSVEVWVWPFSSLQLQSFIHIDAGASSAIAYYNTDKHFHVNWGAVDSIGANPYTEQNWYHVVITHDGTTQKLYVNGTSEASAISSTSSSTAAAYYFGRNSPNSHFLSGWFCEAAIYTSALSSSRVSAHHAAQEYSGAPVWNASGLSAQTGVNPVANNSSSLTQVLANMYSTYQNSP